MSTTFDTDAIRSTLVEERQRLLHSLEELGATPAGDLRPDVDFADGFSDAAAATSERTERLGLVENTKNLLDDVEAALTRIDDGTYGTCISCGKEINPLRLEARPESGNCVDCKSKRS